MAVVGSLSEALEVADSCSDLIVVNSVSNGQVLGRYPYEFIFKKSWQGHKLTGTIRSLTSGQGTRKEAIEYCRVELMLDSTWMFDMEYRAKEYDDNSDNRNLGYAPDKIRQISEFLDRKTPPLQEAYRQKLERERQVCIEREKYQWYVLGKMKE